MSASTLIFDLETQHLADEVGGWSHIAKMKMACAVTLDCGTGDLYDYGKARQHVKYRDKFGRVKRVAVQW